MASACCGTIAAEIESSFSCKPDGISLVRHPESKTNNATSKQCTIGFIKFVLHITNPKININAIQVNRQMNLLILSIQKV